MEKGEMGENATGRLAAYYVAECMEFNRYEDIEDVARRVKEYMKKEGIGRENVDKYIGEYPGDYIYKRSSKVAKKLHKFQEIREPVLLVIAGISIDAP